jgi:hypothetical protein
MQVSAILIGFFLFGASVAYVILPFRRKPKKAASPLLHSAHLPGQREVVFSALRDLDFDFKTGKISEEDYHPLREQLLVEAAQYMQEENKNEDRLEQMIQARRTGRQQGSECPQCDAPVLAGHHFCSKCGYELTAESCPSCGKHIQEGDLFCSSCGHRIQAPVRAVAES